MQELLAYLAHTQGPSGKLGKKAAQKFVHILSSLSDADVGYEFSFYTYGPFSRELASDLDLLNNARILNVSYNSFDNSYSISATEKAADVVRNLPADIRQEADRIWAIFSGRTAKDLELTSTILFLHDDEGIDVGGQAMIERVQSLKPKYSEAEIKTAQKEVATLV